MKDCLQFPPVLSLHCSFVIVNLVGVDVGMTLKNAEPMLVQLPMFWVCDWKNSDEPVVRLSVTPTRTFDVINGKVCTESLLVFQVGNFGSVVYEGLHHYLFRMWAISGA